MNPKVRLTDIARESEVSPSTVSLVLRNKPGIPAPTRRRVLEAARRLGYRREDGASAPNPQVLQSLGLVVKADAGDTPQANPFYSLVLAGIEDACRSRQINLLYATLPVDAHNIPVETPRLLIEQSVDGLLLVGAFVDETLNHVLGERSVPVVLVDAYSGDDTGDQAGSQGRSQSSSQPGAAAFDAVVSDNVRGARQAVSYLLACGHRAIGMVGGGDDEYPSLRERREGYRQALRAASVTCEYLADCTADNVGEAVHDLLHRCPEVTALFACNDRAAIAALRAAQVIGRRVPEDLSIVGFDDIELAAHMMPALTTMHVDKVTMGRMAVQLLEARLAFPASEQVTLLLRPRLIERDTVRRLSASMLNKSTQTGATAPADHSTNSPAKSISPRKAKEKGS